MLHCIFCSPNWLLQLSLGLGCHRNSVPSSLFSSKLAPPLHYLAIPPLWLPSADSDSFSSTIENLAHFALAPIVFTVDIVTDVLHSGICPFPCSHCPEFLGLLLALPQHGRMVLPYNFSVSYFFLLLIVHLPFYDLAIRLHGMMSIQNCPFSEQSVWLGQVHDEFTLAFVSCPVVSGLVVISNHQPVLIWNNFPVCGFTPFCAPWVPVVALGVEVPCECCATSLLPDDFLPIQSPRWSLCWLPCSLILNVYDPDYFVSPLLMTTQIVLSPTFLLKSFCLFVIRPLPLRTTIYTLCLFWMSYVDWLILIHAVSLGDSCRHTTSPFRFPPVSSMAMVHMDDLIQLYWITLIMRGKNQ